MEDKNKQINFINKVMLCKKCNKKTVHIMIGKKFTTNRYWMCTECKHTKFM